MKRLLLGATFAATILFASACAPTAPQATATPAPAAPVAAIPYGANPAASGTFIHDGVRFYYETYGEGDPLLVVHGNGGSIGTLSAQIDFFKAHYRVIAMDSREQGKSGSSDAPINYEVMTDDLAALLDHLKTGPVSVLGWSDGGIEACCSAFAIRARSTSSSPWPPTSTRRSRRVYPETDAFAKEAIASIPADARSRRKARDSSRSPA